MTEYLATQEDKDRLNASLAKGDGDGGWTTVSRRNIRGRQISADEEMTIGGNATEGRRTKKNQNQLMNKTQDTTTASKLQNLASQHVRILKRSSNTGPEELNQNSDNVSQKTAGILRIPNMNVLVDEGTARWKEFNVTKEVWPSIDACKKEDNEAMRSGVKSYSSILSAAPQVVAPSLTVDNKANSHSGSEEEQVKSEVQKIKKKKKKKNKSALEVERRTDKPVTIDFSSILDVKSSFKPNQPDTTTTSNTTTFNSPKRLVLSSTPLINSHSTNKPLNVGKATTLSHVPHNMLDSTAPLVKRGKERETPAKKRPSALKKVILKEREEKKKLRDTGELKPDSVSGQLKKLSMADGAHDEEATQVTSGSHDPQQQELSEGDVTDIQAILPSQKPKQLHNRKFREYCDHMLSPEIDNYAVDLLSDLYRFQTRAYLKDPIKARAKRRYVLGLREVTKHLRLKRIKCVIASPNMERIRSTGGIDEMLMHIIKLCNDYNIAMVYALNRKKMGAILRKKVPVSIVGIFSYDGAEQHYKKMVQLVSEKREMYHDKLQTLLQTVTTAPDECVIQEVEEGDSPGCDDDDYTPYDDEEGQIDQYLYEDVGSWDQPLLHANDIIQGPCDTLQEYYYIPTYYQSPYSQLNINAPEFVPSWRYS